MASELVSMHLRVVLDTNVLASGLAYPGGLPGHLLTLCRCGVMRLVLSNDILNELARILPRLKKNAVTAAQAQTLADALRFEVELVEPANGLEPRLRDAADQSVLNTLRAAHADYLITGDKDLLALADTYPIVTPAIFWAKHGV